MITKKKVNGNIAPSYQLHLNSVLTFVSREIPYGATVLPCLGY